MGRKLVVDSSLLQEPELAMVRQAAEENGLDLEFYKSSLEGAAKAADAEILFGGKEEYVTLALYEYDPKQWDYDAVYVIRRDGGDEYFGFYEWDSEIWMDYFNDDRDLDSLVMTEHYES